MGREVGLSPMQSLAQIAVINGRPSMWGDALLALVKKSGECEYVNEWQEDAEGGDVIAYCETKRKSDPRPTIRMFSKKDAIRAELGDKRGQNGKPTPWVTYPQRMLQMRARSWCLRDVYPDILMGLIQAEEAQDIPEADWEPTPTVEERIEENAEEHRELAESLADKYRLQGTTEETGEPEQILEEEPEEVVPLVEVPMEELTDGAAPVVVDPDAPEMALPLTPTEPSWEAPGLFEDEDEKDDLPF